MIPTALEGLHFPNERGPTSQHLGVALLHRRKTTAGGGDHSIGWPRHTIRPYTLLKRPLFDWHRCCSCNLSIGKFWLLK